MIARINFTQKIERNGTYSRVNGSQRLPLSPNLAVVLLKLHDSSLHTITNHYIAVHENDLPPRQRKQLMRTDAFEDTEIYVPEDGTLYKDGHPPEGRALLFNRATVINTAVKSAEVLKAFDDLAKNNDAVDFRKKASDRLGFDPRLLNETGIWRPIQMGENTIIEFDTAQIKKGLQEIAKDEQLKARHLPQLIHKFPWNEHRDFGSNGNGAKGK